MSNSPEVRAKNAELMRKWGAANPEKYKRNSLRADLKRYGLSISEYEALVEAQGGLCAICRKPPGNSTNSRRLSVDHDHDTGVVRGLLCKTCNTYLGRLGPHLDRLINYLDGSIAHFGPGFTEFPKRGDPPTMKITVYGGSEFA